MRSISRVHAVPDPPGTHARNNSTDLHIEDAVTIAKAVHCGRKSDPHLVYPDLMRIDWNGKQMPDDGSQTVGREFEVMNHIANRIQYCGETEFLYIPFYSYASGLAPPSWKLRVPPIRSFWPPSA